MKKITFNIFQAIAIFIIIAIAASCTPSYVKPDYSIYVWPPQPQKTRIKLLDVIATDLDVRQMSQTESMFGYNAYFKFTKPHDIAADEAGNIIVTDTYLKEVFIINLEQKTIKSLANPKGWISPFGVATDDKNKLLVVTDQNKAYVFSLINFRLIGMIEDKRFQVLNGVALDPERRFIYLCDTRGSAIYKFDYQGAFIQQVAEGGGREQDVYFPSNLALDSQGNLFVTDTMHWKIKSYDPKGNFRFAWGVHGSVPGQFNRPKGIAINRDDILIITDNDLNLFQLFTPTGQPYLYVGGAGTGPGRFSLPAGVFVDKNNKVYVVDQTNRRFQVFQMYTDSYYTELERQAAAMVNATGAIVNATDAPADVAPAAQRENQGGQ